MTPHWVCADSLPASIQAAVMPERGEGVPYKEAMDKCVKQIKQQTSFPEWSYDPEHPGTKTDGDRLTLCKHAQLSESPREPGGSPYLRNIWMDAVAKEVAIGATDVGLVDAYLLTQKAGLARFAG